MKNFCIKTLITIIILTIASSVYAFNISVETGDVVVYGKNRTFDKYSSDYFWHTYLSFLSSAANMADIYDPFFGPDGLDTWDDSWIIEDNLTAWHHIVIIANNSILTIDQYNYAIILRSTALFRDMANMQEIVNKYGEIDSSYNQPILFVFTKWLNRLKLDYPWLAVYPEFTLDFDTAQTSQYGHNDMGSDGFWKRSFDCSSQAMWSVLWGVYKKSIPTFREFFMDNPGAVNAIDCITPGQMGWMLVNGGYYYIAEIGK